MKKSTSQKIIDLIRERVQVAPSELTNLLEMSDRGVRKQLKKLYYLGILGKKGKPPKVFYFINESSHHSDSYPIPPACEKIIKEHFIVITPTGEFKEGTDAFVHFCRKRELPILKSAKDYCEIFQKYSRFKIDNLIDGMSKMEGTFKNVYLDKLYYLDFYSVERFGKTKLGQMLLYAKQSQNEKFIKELITIIKPRIEYVIKKEKIQAIGFVPPTVKREVQIMKEMEKRLKLNVPTVAIVKIKTPITVPQKTLSKLEDRVENARETIVVETGVMYNRILLIDDAVGSGATLNETAAQLKSKNIAKRVVGLAITGSFKGFDVISEV